MNTTTLYAINAGRFSTAIQQINYPMHQGRPNPSHGKFFFVGSIPAACIDTDPARLGRSRIYDTEDQAIAAARAAGATRIQGADCRWID